MKKQRGFTLLEMVVAIGVLSLIALSGQQMLRGVLQVESRTQQHNQTLGELQRLFSLLEQDLMHTLPAQSGHTVALTWDANQRQLTLVRTSRSIDNVSPPAILQRIEWRWQNQGLTRRAGREVDDTTLTITHQFQQIEEFGLRLSNAQAEATLLHSVWGSMTRTFVVAAQP